MVSNMVLIGMASLGITCMVVEKILIATGKIDLAQLINIAGLSMMGIAVLTKITELLIQLSNLPK